MAVQPWRKGIVTRIENEGTNTRRFWIQVPELERFEFTSGQFVTIDLPIHEKPNKRWRSYSIASAWPGAGPVELTVQRVPDGEVSTYLTDVFAVGDPVFGDNLNRLGGLGEVARALETSLIPVPEGLGFREAAALPQGAVIALQGIRDNPRRMASLGYHVTAHRVAAYAVAGFLAAVGGVLMVWYNGRISPGSVNTGAMINILVIAVLGGMKHPVGAFVGALVFVLLQNFAIDLVDRERFNLVIGGVFLAIVLFSPDGLLGLWRALVARLHNPRRQPR